MTEYESNETSYDVVGRYNQNKVNGFQQQLIDRMLEVAELGTAETVLDAMGGDGNLSASIIDYCRRNNFSTPKLTLFEISRVQCKFRSKTPQVSEVFRLKTPHATGSGV